MKIILDAKVSTLGEELSDFVDLIDGYCSNP